MDDSKKKAMITIYGMESCPYCTYVEEQIRHDDRFVVIDIGTDVHALKQFLKLRDSSPVFDRSRKIGDVGIPCFVLEDGTVTLKPEDVGLVEKPDDGASCKVDGSGC